MYDVFEVVVSKTLDARTWGTITGMSECYYDTLLVQTVQRHHLGWCNVDIFPCLIFKAAQVPVPSGFRLTIIILNQHKNMAIFIGKYYIVCT